jgi:hypothetical protein
MLRKLVLLAVFAAIFAGCGNKTELTTVAETEGIYLDVGGLTYQVQLSRFLNPGDVEDKEYLVGLPEGVPAQLPGDEIWFGVWMRVKNYTDETQPPTSTFMISDTEDNEFLPIPQNPAINPFVYDPQPIPLGGGVLPPAGSAAASGPIQGSLILFRLRTESLQNRPLELHIGRGEGQEAIVDLDL